MHCYVLRVCDYRRGMEWLLDLLILHGTTRNYSDTADLHTLQFTTAPAKPFPACCVFNSNSLATASNSGDYSASRGQILLTQPPVQNSCQFPQLPKANYQLSLLCRAQLN
jgi:hypothetical protein